MAKLSDQRLPARYRLQFSCSLAAILALLTLIGAPVFAQTGSVQGTVTENGTALQSAQVILDSSSFPNVTDVTNASGSYVFNNVSSGAAFTVRVFAPDGVVIGLQVASLAAGETKIFDFDLARGIIAGTITEDGQPLQGARVTSHTFNLANPVFHTGPDGTFSLSRQSGAVIDMRVFAPDSVVIGKASPTAVAGTTSSGFDFDLRRATIHGTIIDSGIPLAGATIRDFTFNIPNPSVTADMNGEFTTSLQSGINVDHTVRVGGSQFCRNPNLVTLSPGQTFEVVNCDAAPTVIDSDGDGVPDDEDICEGGDDNIDGDGDGVPDFCDTCPLDYFNDSDGDGVCDSDDVCLGDDSTGDGDSDGLCDDADPCFGASNSDIDGDGVCDEGDLCFGDDASGNSDGDGVCDDLDACEGNDQAGDTDGDLFCDDIDGCPLDIENDVDGDGICEVADNCDLDANPSQNDNDMDGAGDVCDVDDDNDGIVDEADNCPWHANADQSDFDGDGAGDVCDTDDDADGLQDADDVCPSSPIGAIVNAEGCAIADICPCENNWKNHGAYVRCVSHTANDFIDLGLIGQTEHGDIVAGAASSSCGHRN